MLHSHLQNTQKKKKRSSFKIIFPLLLIGALGAGIYWSARNYQRLIYLVKKDRYAALELELEQIEGELDRWAKSEGEYPENRVENFAGLMQDLSTDHPEDVFIHYMKGVFYTGLLESRWKKNPLILSDLIFLKHAGHLEHMEKTNATAIRRGVAAARKALAIGLPKEEEAVTRENLMKLYLMHGPDYWNAAMELGHDTLNETIIYQIYAILLHQRRPDWAALHESFGAEAMKTWQSIYFIEQGDTPQAFRVLKELTASESVYVQNNACYLLGQMRGGLKNRKLRLYYYRQIDLGEFLPRNRWFLEEFHKLLVDTGNHIEARKLLSGHETGGE